MTAASRALTALLIGLAVQVATPAPSAAQVLAPSCPAEVAGLPLSVSVPFSGTVRPEAGDGGEFARVRLLCAYGEGLEASAELRLTWDPRASDTCAEVDQRVAEGVDEAAFTAAGSALVDAVGGPCPDAEGMTWPLVPVAVATGALGLVGVLVRGRRRSRSARVATEVTLTRDDDGAEAGVEAETDRRPDDEVDADVEPEVVPAPVHQLVEEHRGDVAPPPDEAEESAPDVTPVLAELRAPDAWGFTRSDTGQLAAIAALAYRSGDRLTGDAVAAEVRRRRGARRPARGDLVGVARGLASQEPGDGR